MAIIRCVAIDDEPLALELIKTYIAGFPELKLIQTFSDAIAGRQFLNQSFIELLFVDINMPDINGIDLVRSLKARPMIIFTTAYRKFAVDSYDLDAIDYLLKPIELERFSRAVKKAIEYQKYKSTFEKNENEVLFVRSEYQLVKIYFEEIEYIESVEDYLKIHLREGKPVMTLMTLKAIAEKLPSHQFRRIHRSYIIPFNKVRSVVNRKVRLTYIELPIGDRYTSFVQEWARK